MKRTFSQDIATSMKKFRQDRAVSQIELSRLLKISQPQLSQVENGKGSLTAEQLLTLCEAYNLTLLDFLPRQKNKQSIEGELQNALIGFGASHLMENRGVFVSQRFQDIHEVIIEVLISATSSRHMVALAPVFLNSFDRIRIPTIYKRLSELGFAQRLLWLLSHVCLALSKFVEVISDEKQKREVARKAATIVTEYEVLKAAFLRSGQKKEEDVLFPRLTAPQSISALRDRRDSVAREWEILTDIGVEDFYQFLLNSSDLKLKGH